MIGVYANNESKCLQIPRPEIDGWGILYTEG